MVFLSALLIVVFTSCGRIPQAEIDQAKAAVENTRGTGAELYAPDAFMALEDSLNSALALVETQDSKLFKNFSKSKEKLAKVTEMATKVSEQAEMKKNEMKLEIESLTANVRTLLDENKMLIAKAPRGKEGAAALEEIKSEMLALEAEIARGEENYAEGDYFTALELIKAAQQGLSSINTELKDAISKASGAKKVK